MKYQLKITGSLATVDNHVDCVSVYRDISDTENTTQNIAIIDGIKEVVGLFDYYIDSNYQITFDFTLKEVQQ